MLSVPTRHLKGLLILRNTPIKCGMSLAQLLKGHCLRDNLPRIFERRQQTSQDLIVERQIAKKYHQRVIQVKYHSAKRYWAPLYWRPNSKISGRKTWESKILKKVIEYCYFYQNFSCVIFLFVSLK